MRLHLKGAKEVRKQESKEARKQGRKNLIIFESFDHNQKQVCKGLQCASHGGAVPTSLRYADHALFAVVLKVALGRNQLLVGYIGTKECTCNKRKIHSQFYSNVHWCSQLFDA
jgi:hypothetical protein